MKMNILDWHFESGQSISVFLVQWPADLRVQRLHRGLSLFSHMPHDWCHHFAFIEFLLAFDDVLWWHSTFRQIDITYRPHLSAPRSESSLVATHTLLFVHPQNHNNLISPYPDELLYTPYTSPRELRKQNHAVNVVVFQQFDICAHLSNLLHIHLVRNAFSSAQMGDRWTSLPWLMNRSLDTSPHRSDKWWVTSRRLNSEVIQSQSPNLIQYFHLSLTMDLNQCVSCSRIASPSVGTLQKKQVPTRQFLRRSPRVKISCAARDLQRLYNLSFVRFNPF